MTSSCSKKKENSQRHPIAHPRYIFVEFWGCLRFTLAIGVICAMLFNNGPYIENLWLYVSAITIKKHDETTMEIMNFLSFVRTNRAFEALTDGKTQTVSMSTLPVIRFNPLDLTSLIWVPHLKTKNRSVTAQIRLVCLENGTFEEA